MADFFLHTKQYNKIPTWDMLCKMLYYDVNKLALIECRNTMGVFRKHSHSII